MIINLIVGCISGQYFQFFLSVSVRKPTKIVFTEHNADTATTKVYIIMKQKYVSTQVYSSGPKYYKCCNHKAEFYFGVFFSSLNSSSILFWAITTRFALNFKFCHLTFIYRQLSKNFICDRVSNGLHTNGKSVTNIHKYYIYI